MALETLALSILGFQYSHRLKLFGVFEDVKGGSTIVIIDII